MLELVRGYAAAAFDTAANEGRLDAVVTGLVEISRLFIASEPLRNAITDSTIPAQARGAVLEDLLADKVPEEALAIITFVVEYERARRSAEGGRAARRAGRDRPRQCRGR